MLHVVAVDLVYYVMCIIRIHDVCDVCVCVVGARFRFRIHARTCWARRARRHARQSRSAVASTRQPSVSNQQAAHKCLVARAVCKWGDSRSE